MYVSLVLLFSVSGGVTVSKINEVQPNLAQLRSMPSLYRCSRRGGSGDAVRSEMKTRLNGVVKVWVSIV